MLLSGIRDTSTMRKPTVSYVQEFEERLVGDTIGRELARDGQCYYVVPRISQLEVQVSFYINLLIRFFERVY
jgi:transcription-repair coupling factor (superfamily II helicase)